MFALIFVEMRNSIYVQHVQLHVAELDICRSINIFSSKCPIGGLVLLSYSDSTLGGRRLNLSHCDQNIESVFLYFELYAPYICILYCYVM